MIKKINVDKLYPNEEVYNKTRLEYIAEYEEYHSGGIFSSGYYIKNPKAQRTKIVEQLKDKSQRKILLTGTPILNRPSELFMQLKVLDNPLAKNWFQYMKKYAGAKQTRFGLDTSGATNLDELQQNLRSTCMLRRMKKDVLKELPDKRRQLIEIEAVGDLKKQIEKEKEILLRNTLITKQIKNLKKNI